MSQETTYAGMLGDWDRWAAALTANEAQLGHLQVPKEQLGSMALRGKSLIQQQSELAAAKQDASKELRVVMVEGQRLVTLLRVAVRQHYGIDSEKLVLTLTRIRRNLAHLIAGAGSEIPQVVGVWRVQA